MHDTLWECLNLELKYTYFHINTVQYLLLICEQFPEYLRILYMATKSQLDVLNNETIHSCL